MDIGNSLSSWRNISTASHFYEGKGYTYYPTAWAVEEEFHRVTFDGALSPLTTDTYLVGSAEQSFVKDFISLPVDTFLYAISPCFRLADAEKSPYHHAYFLKLELFYRGSSQLKNKGALTKVIFDADTFFTTLGAICALHKLSEESYDLEIKGVEVGSYGIRTTKAGSFCYGTGLAEPRFSLTQI